MAISLASLVTKASPKPPIILVHGLHGLGKTSFGAAAPNPVGIFTEDGLGKLEFPHFPQVESYSDVMDAIGALYGEENDRKTLVFDSLDHFEPLVWAETCHRHGWQSIEQPGYGKGYNEADIVWAEFFDAIAALRNDREMIIYLIAHTRIERFESPETEPYDRYTIKLHKRAAALAQEKADAVFFLNQRTTTKDNETTKDAKNAPPKSVRGGGLGPKTLFTERRPAFEAKNRYSLPAEIPLGAFDEMPATWDGILEYVFN